MLLTSTNGQKNLPRYFAQVFDGLNNLNNGRVDFALRDGRIFRAEGKNPGPIAILEVKDDDIFGRLIREGDLGFCEAYLDGGWNTPDLQASWILHMQTITKCMTASGMSLVRAFEKLRFWLQAIPNGSR